VTVLLAVAVVVLLIPAGVHAAGTLVSIVDGNGTSKANVDNGKLRIGDGNGALTVDGRIREFGTPVHLNYQDALDSDGAIHLLYTVPSGKRLVIETVSLNVNLPGATTVRGAFVSAQGSSLRLFIPLDEASPGSAELEGTEQVRAYAPPGDHVGIVVDLSSSVHWQIFATVTGYLTPA
jgi:hypothetical protein